MKKKFKVIIITVAIMALVFSAKPLYDLSSKLFWNFIVFQLDKEEQERIEDVAKDKAIRGRDTLLIWGEKYEIGKTMSNINLTISSTESTDIVLSNIDTYKVIKKSLYIISNEGYAVIDKDNKCRVFITISTDEFVNGYSYSRYIENSNIEYLSDIDEFSSEEQRILKKLVND